MSQDAYQPCPCGSGKKLKFCCQDIADDMTRALRLHETNQPRLALQTVEKLAAQHPDLPWVYIGLATILLSEDRPGEAKQYLSQLLLRQPEHPLGIALNATAAISVDGYEKSKAALYRAFQRCGRAFPHIISGLAMGVASIMMSRRRFLSCRQYLTLAMRLAADDSKQEIFVRLLEFDNNEQIPYPLRSVHQLAEYSGSEESMQTARQAMALAGTGCFESAARLYERLAEPQPDNPALLRNWGLCLAWSGDEAAAAAALHRAAAHESDPAMAVELETLAQLLEMNTGKDAVKFACWEYQVSSVSRLLTLLQAQSRFANVELDIEDQVPGQIVPAGAFQVLDRPASSGETLGTDNVAKVLGELSVYDANPEQDQAAKALLVALEGDPFERAKALCEEVFASEVAQSAASDRAADFEPVPRDLLAMQMNWHFPDEARPPERREFIKRYWEQLISETWPSTPLASLGGRTPLEAAPDSAERVPLLAAIHVLDAFCEQQGHMLDLNGLCQRIGVEPLPPLELTATTSLSAASVLQLIRLPAEQLSDDQFSATLNRALLIYHSRFLYGVLLELLKRPACLGRVDLDRVYNTLADLSIKQFRPEEAIQWLAKAREQAEHQENAFDARLRCDLRELAVRLNTAGDPQLPALLQRFASYYLPKVPAIRQNLDELLALYGIEPPWQTAASLAVGQSVAAGAEAGIWTPDVQGAPGGGKKLWIPGAD